MWNFWILRATQQLSGGLEAGSPACYYELMAASGLITSVSPAECLGRAQSYMLSKPGTTKILQRTEDSVSFAYRPPVGPVNESNLTPLMALYSFGVAWLFFAFRFVYPQKARLVARVSEDGKTRVLVEGRTEVLIKELRRWTEHELAEN